MNIVVRDIIDGLERKAQENGQKKKTLLIDTYSLAALREELGIQPEDDLEMYHGYKIKVQEDESEVIRIV